MRLHDLIAHKGYADAALLHAVRQHPAASADTELRSLLHHVLISNRFWLLSIVGESFVAEAATRGPAPLDVMIADFRAIHDRETAWLANATDQALSRTLENEFIPGGRCTISDALLQVCLHSQGHRAQCAKMLRALGCRPPATDFILWLVDRPAPAWPALET